MSKRNTLVEIHTDSKTKRTPLFGFVSPFLLEAARWRNFSTVMEGDWQAPHHKTPRSVTKVAGSWIPVGHISNFLTRVSYQRVEEYDNSCLPLQPHGTFHVGMKGLDCQLSALGTWHVLQQDSKTVIPGCPAESKLLLVDFKEESIHQISSCGPHISLFQFILVNKWLERKLQLEPHLMGWMVIL